MRSLGRSLDDLLRGGLGVPLLRGIALAVGGGLVYGAVMGSYGGWAGERVLQVLYSALKVPLLLLVTFALTLPSFFVINTVLGLRSDFPAVLRGVVTAQAGVAIVLAALAPYTALWYLTSGGYHEAILFNAGIFGVASLAAQAILRRHYRPLIAREPRHRRLLRGWLLIYAFVGIQMGWVLRPFIGEIDTPTRFFREETWGNAYVKIMEMVVYVVRRW